MDVTETTLEDFGYIDSAAGDASGASAVEQVLASRRIADCARDILRRLGEVHGRSEVVLNEHPEELLAILGGVRLFMFFFSRCLWCFKQVGP